MQPAFGGGFGPPKKEKKDDKKHDGEKNLFGTEFPWVEADATIDGRTLKKVGLRYSGDMTYFVSTRGLKRPLKLGFDKLDGPRFNGLAAVQLHAMPLDPAKAREALAFSAFRAAGVPSPQTAFAEVTLTVPGKHDSAMPAQKPLQNQPDPDRAVPHLAVRALVALNAIDPCLEALDGPHWQGALWAMRYFHDPRAVDGLVMKLGTVRTPELRRGILVTLIRLYHREADYAGSWWGIRLDNTGPYYDRAEWAMTKRIAAVVTAAVLDSDKDAAALLKAELVRHRVALAGITTGADVAAVKEEPLVLPKADPKNPNQIGNMAYDAAARRALAAKGDAKTGEALFKAHSCVACHTTADGQTQRNRVPILHRADAGDTDADIADDLGSTTNTAANVRRQPRPGTERPAPVRWPGQAGREGRGGRHRPGL